MGRDGCFRRSNLRVRALFRGFITVLYALRLSVKMMSGVVYGTSRSARMLVTHLADSAAGVSFVNSASVVLKETKF